jgi:hypothetical protein
LKGCCGGERQGAPQATAVEDARPIKPIAQRLANGFDRCVKVCGQRFGHPRFKSWQLHDQRLDVRREHVRPGVERRHICSAIRKANDTAAGRGPVGQPDNRATLRGGPIGFRRFDLRRRGAVALRQGRLQQLALLGRSQ